MNNMCDFIYAKPESVGIKSKNIHRYIELLEEANLCTHCLIIMRHGKIISENYWEPFHKDFLHRQYSVTKSFVSLAIGFLEQDGMIDIDLPVSRYFPEELKNQPDENMKNQTNRHMQMMTTAKTNENWFEARCEDRVRFYFENSLDETRPAGTVFQYDSTGSFVLGALVERITGKELMTYLREKFLDKIGFPKEAYMLKCPGGHSWGDSGLVCKATDLLRTTQFVMNNGRWNGEQLLNREYITKATSKQTDNNIMGVNTYRTQGYGYQFWRAYDNSFLFNGMGDQLAICVPDTDIIMVINSDNQGNIHSRKTIVDNFFDLIVRRAVDGGIAESHEDTDKLEDYAATLKLFAVKGESYNAIQEKCSGVTYNMNDNPMGITKIRLCFTGDKGVFCYTNAQGDKEIPFGMGHNEFSEFPQEGYSDEIGSQKGTRLYKCAASGAWVSDYQLLIKVQIIDTYFGYLNIGIGFTEDNKIGVCMTKAAEDFLNEYQGFAGGTKQTDI